MRALLLLLAGPAVACGLDWQAGFEQPIQTPSLPSPARVDLPENWVASGSWPAIFYYAGTGGKADVETMRSHTGGRDFIVVGMPPRDGGAFIYTVPSLQLEQRTLEELRARLAAEIGLNPRKVLVAGFSKGGWMSGLLLAHTPWLAGGCVMGGGWIEHQHEPPRRFAGPTYIYVGDGRLDGNYPTSLRASREFAALGAHVTWEVWPETGHALPHGGAEGLRQWLALLARGPGAVSEAQAWAPPEFARISALPDPLAQWTELRRFATQPFTRALGEAMSQPIVLRLAELQRQPAVAAEAALVRELEAITERETQDMKVTTLEAVGPRYRALAARAPHSPSGRLAAHDASRIEGLWKTVPAAK